MMRKIRIVPVLFTAAAAALVLFGGWLLYTKVAVEGPLDKAVNEIADIASADAPVIERDQVTIKLTLAPDASLKDVYDSINKEGKDVIGGRELKLDISNADSSDKLERLWSTVLFDVAEAMEKKNYSGIPTAMDKMAQTDEGKGVKSVTEIDEKNVYITIIDGDHRKYVVLPRTPIMLEVPTYA
ncbi:hypothetical protein [Paenibacillus sp. NEAU-GSW1]|uniref:hypothetical protein n=1 Tax=Paenibacillus sp. NEAU-GSW1 TaxID=2682486 RepID=UPI0012E116EF|nr:hypothetical protein [Paenibacillus sp. NEAU-GSW1]MUT65439.1 hypothetical protein [Paenibacillus sp. NEAU-GSW1]